MKLNPFANLLLLGIILTLTAVGCKKNPGYITNIPGHKANMGDIGGAPLNTAPIAPLDNPNGIPAAGMANFEGRPEDRGPLAASTVYFDYDSSVVKSSQVSKLQDVATFLKNNPADALLIEGHCDERGTEEYNRALGEKRAQALREYLATKLGVDSGNIRTISYGKDRPADPGHNDTAWAKNRRGEFVVLLPKPQS
jgi:peptidoglycan-associated lipoprotein